MRRCRPMPPAGRPRKPNPKIPAHIDQSALPKGVYWNPLGLGRWYVLKGKSKDYFAGKDALLSELHAKVESGKRAAHSVQALCDGFTESDPWAKLKPATRDDYGYCAAVVCRFRLKDGTKLGQADARGLTRPLLQRLVTAIGKGTNGKPTPSKAAHVARYLGVLIRWGANEGLCTEGIAGKFNLPAEKKDARMPEAAQHDALVTYARQQAKRGVKDAVAPYLWAVAEIAYRCRLRGVEVLDLTEASGEPEGVRCIRRKGSETNVAAWSPELRAAWDFLLAYRDGLWTARKRPVPLRAQDRPLVVSLSGDALPRRALTQAWGRLGRLAVARGILSADQRFGLHGLKHRGVTDTPGTRGEKRQASGHKTEAMVARYDHEVPCVPAAGRRE